MSVTVLLMPQLAHEIVTAIFCWRRVFQPPFIGHFPVIFQLTFGVHVYIVAADAFALSSERHRPVCSLRAHSLHLCDMVRCARIARTCVLSL